MTGRTAGTRSEPRQVDAGELNVGYADVGPADGPAVLLLHGWPYDIHSYAEVAPLLADAGHRVIVPHLRGYGTTRFRSTGDALRNGQQAALALDADRAARRARHRRTRSSAASTGAHARRTSSPRCGPSAAAGTSRSAAT